MLCLGIHKDIWGHMGFRAQVNRGESEGNKDGR